MFVLLAVIVLAFSIFYYVLTLNIPGVWKFFIIAIEMLLAGQFLIWRYKFSGEYGLILLKSRRGLDIINKLAQYDGFWKFFSDVGVATSYGVLSLVVMRRNVSLKSFVVGIVLLAALFFVVGPFVLPFLVSVTGFSTLERSIEQGSGISAIASLSIFLLFAGGLFIILLLSILAYGVFILAALLSTVLHGTQAIAQAVPGGTLLLPGINLPFLEGITALIIILIVHEGCHAILARIGKIPVLSSGIVLFGVIPVGAFVEPDEDKLKQLEKTKQTRVLVAGSTANLVTSILFFILFIGFFYATADYREAGLLVSAGMEKNTVIHAINGQPVVLANYQKLELPKNSEVILSTNKGEILRKTDASGKMGVLIRPITRDSLFSVYTSPVFEFIYMLLGLTFSLNFVIGTVNMLPLPFFDGYRTLEVNIENKHILKGLMALTLIAFAINFLPWFFK